MRFMKTFKNNFSINYAKTFIIIIIITIITVFTFIYIYVCVKCNLLRAYNINEIDNY